MNGRTHRAIREAIRARIVAGEWGLGERIPGEAAFAEEYDCARTTVNRAIRALADEGIVERKRKRGTRVRPLPLPQAQLAVPLVREEIEASGRRYSHRVLERASGRAAPPEVARGMKLAGKPHLEWLQTLHLADGAPFALERRWVNLAAVPAFARADLRTLSANEWLVRTVPFTTGEVALSATAADASQARLLGVEPGSPLFTLRRTTWLDDQPITTMTLFYPRDYALGFTLGQPAPMD